MNRSAFSWVLVVGVASAQAPDPQAWSVEESVARLADSEMRGAAVERLVAHGAAAVPALVALLAELPIRREAVDAHRAALQVVGRLGADALPARSALLQVVREGHLHLVGSAIEALEATWPHDPAFFEEGEGQLDEMLARAERDRLEDHRIGSLRYVHGRLVALCRGRVPPGLARGVLALLGSPAQQTPLFIAVSGENRSGVPKLVAELERQLTFPFPPRPGLENPFCYELDCAEALIALDPKGRNASTAWSYVLCYHPWPERRLAAARALRYLPHVGARGVADAVLAGCEDPDLDVALEALPLVSVHCRDAAQARAVLERLVAGDRPRVAGVAAGVLRGFDRDR